MIVDAQATEACHSMADTTTYRNWYCLMAVLPYWQKPSENCPIVRSAGYPDESTFPSGGSGRNPAKCRILEQQHCFRINVSIVKAVLPWRVSRFAGDAGGSVRALSGGHGRGVDVKRASDIRQHYSGICMTTSSRSGSVSECNRHPATERRKNENGP